MLDEKDRGAVYIKVGIRKLGIRKPLKPCNELKI
jgi:hypothetical protein